MPGGAQKERRASPCLTAPRAARTRRLHVGPRTCRPPMHGVRLQPAACLSLCHGVTHGVTLADPRLGCAGRCPPRCPVPRGNTRRARPAVARLSQCGPSRGLACIAIAAADTADGGLTYWPRMGRRAGWCGLPADARTLSMGAPPGPGPTRTRPDRDRSGDPFRKLTRAMGRHLGQHCDSLSRVSYTCFLRAGAPRSASDLTVHA